MEYVIMYNNQIKSITSCPYFCLTYIDISLRYSELAMDVLRQRAKLNIQVDRDWPNRKTSFYMTTTTGSNPKRIIKFTQYKWKQFLMEWWRRTVITGMTILVKTLITLMKYQKTILKERYMFMILERELTISSNISVWLPWLGY
jgi:hypothetical protein